MKKIKKLVITLLCFILVVNAYTIPASAASYPLVIGSVEPGVVHEGDVAVLTLKIFPEFKNEEYHMRIYDSEGNEIGYLDDTYYNNSTSMRTVNITIDTNDLGMSAGEYEIVYWLSFYSLYEWHDIPNKYTRYLSVIEAPNGWNLVDGYWYYYEDGNLVTDSWRKDSIGWCYLGTDGAMVTNTWLQDSDGWCYVGADGYCVTGNYYIDDTYHDFDSEGNWLGEANSSSGMINGWDLVDGYWYYYEDGNLVTDSWRKDSIGWCYLGTDGAMVTNAWLQDSDGWCYVGADGYCVTGNYYIDGTYHKFDSEGNWLGEANASSGMINGWDLVDGYWYYYEDGNLVTDSWRKDSVGWCYLGADGAMVTNTWLQDSDGWCYVGTDGYCVTGGCYIDGIYYEFDSEGNWLG